MFLKPDSCLLLYIYNNKYQLGTILYEYWLSWLCFNGHYLLCFWNFTILTPFSIIIENLKSFKCYPWYSLIKRLLRSFQGLIMVKKQWKFSNRINVYRLWEWMSISAWQVVLLAALIIWRSQCGIIICSPNYPGLPEYCMKLDLLPVQCLWKIEWQFIFTTHDKHKRNYELILNLLSRVLSNWWHPLSHWSQASELICLIRIRHL